jgi:hypothetical protein
MVHSNVVVETEDQAFVGFIVNTDIMLLCKANIVTLEVAVVIIVTL